MILLTPFGDSIENPSPEQIIELLQQDETYWNMQSGSASLSQYPIEEGKEALLFYNDGEYGYVILQLNDYKAPFDECAYQTLLITHLIGGDPFPVPACSHVSYEKAEEILLYYLNHGAIPQYQQWREIYDFYDYDAYIESDDYYNGTRIFRQSKHDD